MINKYTNLPKNQYPNIIRKSYKDMYFISFREIELRFAKSPYRIGVDTAYNAWRSCKSYFAKLEAPFTTQSRGEKILVNSINNYSQTLNSLLSFPSLKSAYKYLVAFSNAQDLSKLNNYKTFLSNSELLIAYESNLNLRLDPILVYELYQIEILPKGDPKFAFMSFSKRNLLEYKPSAINKIINWQPNPSIFLYGVDSHANEKGEYGDIPWKHGAKD